MREIKFRAWDKHNRKIIQVNKLSLYPDSGWSICAHCGLHVGLAETEYNLMQFTGLKDRNGKEIYEGDILRIHRTGHETLPISPDFYVKWDVNCFNVPRISWIYYAIGNIYENPELLK